MTYSLESGWLVTVYLFLYRFCIDNFTIQYDFAFFAQCSSFVYMVANVLPTSTAHPSGKLSPEFPFLQLIFKLFGAMVC